MVAFIYVIDKNIIHNIIYVRIFYSKLKLDPLHREQTLFIENRTSNSSGLTLELIKQILGEIS